MKRNLTDSNHFLESRRLRFQSDILEQCHCALWVIWEQDYEFCDEADIPVSQSELDSKFNALLEMPQCERTKHRQYIADGCYGAEGVDKPCSVCGYHEPDDTEFDVDDAFNCRNFESEPEADDDFGLPISSSLSNRIMNVMEAVHSTAGNYDEREVAYIASVLMDLTSEDLIELHNLDREQIPCSYDELYDEVAD